MLLTSQVKNNYIQIELKLSGEDKLGTWYRDTPSVHVKRELAGGGIPWRRILEYDRSRTSDRRG